MERDMVGPISELGAIRSQRIERTVRRILVGNQPDMLTGAINGEHSESVDE